MRGKGNRQPAAATAIAASGAIPTAAANANPTAARKLTVK
jgi:hypothetical protein